MTDSSEIKLKYFRTFWRAYQWFLIYEFQSTETDLFRLPDHEILQSLTGTRILGPQLSHPEMAEMELEVAVKNVSRPYAFDKLEIPDFKFLKSKADVEKWVFNFKTEGFEEDKEDAQVLIEQAEKELWSRTNLNNGVYHLSKDDFEEDSDKLVDLHWIYFHFETFLEIDRTNSIIRTFDFGYD